MVSPYPVAVHIVAEHCW